MSKIAKESELAKTKMLNMVLPEGMNPTERNKLAQRAGLHEETLRHIRRKKSISADTLIRLLLARGVSLKTLANLPQTDMSKLTKGEQLWAEFGQELEEKEKVEYVSLIKYFKSKWKLDQ